jgi:hypothetical protein
VWLVHHPIPIPGGDTCNFPTGENINENENQGDNGFTSSGRPCQNGGTYKDGPTITHCLPIDNESYELAYDSTFSNVCFPPCPIHFKLRLHQCSPPTTKDPTTILGRMLSLARYMVL